MTIDELDMLNDLAAKIQDVDNQIRWIDGPFSESPLRLVNTENNYFVDFNDVSTNQILIVGIKAGLQSRRKELQDLFDSYKIINT